MFSHIWKKTVQDSFQPYCGGMGTYLSLTGHARQSLSCQMSQDILLLPRLRAEEMSHVL